MLQVKQIFVKPFKVIFEPNTGLEIILSHCDFKEFSNFVADTQTIFTLLEDKMLLDENGYRSEGRGFICHNEFPPFLPYSAISDISGNVSLNCYQNNSIINNYGYVEQYETEELIALFAEIIASVKNCRTITLISTLRELSTRRPLLAREQTELAFLEKIQVADDFYALDAINNELTNTATDPELKARLQKHIAEKKAFY